MAVLVVVYLILVFVVPLMVSGAIGWRGLTRGRRCPDCGNESVPLRARLPALASVLFPRNVIQRRWCMRCGWTGLARLPRGRLPKPNRPARRRLPRRATTRTLTIRLLAVDGAAYRVLLQCWQQTGCYFGRLIFIDPVGRLWLDTVQPIGGLSAEDVVRQALEIPDPLLASRLRLVAER